MIIHQKFVSNVPWIARYTWAMTMLLATVFATQWGVATKQIPILASIFVLYISIALIAQRFGRIDNDKKRFFVFILDLLIWSVYIYFSGGASNPLITLFLTIVSAASIVLTTRYIVTLSCLSVAAYVFLWFFYQPLMIHHEHGVSDKLHLLGMFGVFVFSLIMLTALTVYFKATMNRSYRALDQAQQAIHQQHRLLAVSSFAANIAHEMSTPIASMQLLSDDIASQLDKDDELIEDIELLQTQIKVCRESLDTLKSHIQINHDNDGRYPLYAKTMTTQLDVLLPKLVKDWRFLNPHIQITMDDFKTPITVYINGEQLYAILINILNNALQAGATLIKIEVEQKNQALIKILDNGHGIAEEQLKKIQEQQPLQSDKGWGMGLMLAKTILNYVQGEILIQPIHDENSPNQTAKGTQVIIKLDILQENHQTFNEKLI